MDRHGRAFLRMLAGGYVIYLAIDLIVDQLSGSGTMSNAFAYIAAAVLGIGGAAVCLLSVKDYRRERKTDRQQEKEQAENKEHE